MTAQYVVHAFLPIVVTIKDDQVSNVEADPWLMIDATFIGEPGKRHAVSKMSNHAAVAVGAAQKMLYDVTYRPRYPEGPEPKPE